MNFQIKKLADKKWFVPIIIIALGAIVISSITANNEKAEGIDLDKAQFEQICMAITGEDVNVMITYDESIKNDIWQNKSIRKISGVAVICKSGDDPTVKLKIYEVVKALFNIPSTRITVSGKL